MDSFPPPLPFPFPSSFVRGFGSGSLNEKRYNYRLSFLLFFSAGREENSNLLSPLSPPLSFYDRLRSGERTGSFGHLLPSLLFSLPKLVFSIIPNGKSTSFSFFYSPFSRGLPTRRKGNRYVTSLLPFSFFPKRWSKNSNKLQLFFFLPSPPQDALCLDAMFNENKDIPFPLPFPHLYSTA